MWNAKSLPNDYLDLQVKTWDTDCVFNRYNDDVIFTTSAYSHVISFYYLSRSTNMTKELKEGQYFICLTEILISAISMLVHVETISLLEDRMV